MATPVPNANHRYPIRTNAWTVHCGLVHVNADERQTKGVLYED
jgi:hypothetical protein